MSEQRDLMTMNEQAQALAFIETVRAATAAAHAYWTYDAATVLANTCQNAVKVWDAARASTAAKPVCGHTHAYRDPDQVWRCRDCNEALDPYDLVLMARS